MHELIQAAFAPNNIVYTTLLIVVLLYWMTVIIGALDISSFDIDFDMDADMDIDADIDADMDTDIDGGSGSWLFEAVQFFNFGKVPFMIIMSFVILFQWAISMLLSHYMGDDSIWFALAMFLPMLFVSLVLTKIVTTPLVPVFKNMNEGEEQIDYIGETCKVLLTTQHDKMGQAEVIFNNNPLLINVKTDNENTTLKRNDEALIIDKTENYFIIQKLTD